jgi:hypothetical protein
MSPLLQNIIALTLVAGCLLFVIRQAFAALSGKRSKIGSCCAKGCQTPATTPTSPKSERIAFIPVELLIKRK